MSNEPWISGGSNRPGLLDNGCLGFFVAALALLVVLFW